MRKLIDPNSSCGFCGGYDLGTRCESCGAGSDNYDAQGGEQGWTMKSKLNELRLDAGIARIENQKWLCVLDKESGMMIDPLIGLEKFAELIVEKCAGIIESQDVDPSFKLRMSWAVKEYFGIEQ
jgi:hypothetical protein